MIQPKIIICIFLNYFFTIKILFFIFSHIYNEILFFIFFSYYQFNSIKNNLKKYQYEKRKNIYIYILNFLNIK